MSAPVAHLAAGLLVDVGVKATVLAGAALLVDRVVVASAARRHAGHALMIGALAALPASAWLGRGQALAIEHGWLATVWLVGVVVALTPPIVRRLWLERVARRGLVEGDVVRALPGEVPGPLTFGWWRPRVVVPWEWPQWDAAHRDAALAHERAHVARRDWLVHVAAQVVCALFWFHPLVWLVRARLVDAAEHAADEAALATGIRPSAYASALLRLGRDRPALAGLSAGGSVEARIRAVLADRARPRSPRIVLALGVVALPAALFVLGPWSLWSPPSSPPACLPEPGLLP